MKLKFLILFIVIANLIWAQEPYHNLVITEARMINGDYNEVYFEITNMGDADIDLSKIKFANMGPQGEPVFDLWNDPWIPASNRYFFLPESVAKILKPGESFVLTIALDFGVNMYNLRIPGYGNANRSKQHDIYEYADFLAHRYEKDDIEEVRYAHVRDSSTVVIDTTFDQQDDDIYVPTIGFSHLPQIGFYIEHHFVEGDSTVIDQVGNMFDKENGENSATSWDVAGVNEATTTALLVRKSTIRSGNLDFANARGVGLDDSEWMAVQYPEETDNWRDTWWTVGNHGAYVLDANTLESDIVDVDFAGKKISVPWGTRRLDDIMRKMKRKPGIAWIYHLNDSREDSLFRSAQAGDKLTVYVFGETLYQETFDIEVKEPTAADNTVIPIDHPNLDVGPVTFNAQHGEIGWPRVSMNENGIDTITGGGYGIPNALRVDSLFKYLEKPVNATWEIVSVGGLARADLKTGDKLKVTAQNGDTKEYFIEVQGYSPSYNANLSSITWPDISLSEFDQIIYNWIGDTIPNFNPNGTNFRVRLPFDFDGIPALVSKTEDLNSSVTVDRATTFTGTIEDRTTSFEVTAEDDSVKKVYNVELLKDKNPANVQPYNAEPFLAEIIFKTNGNNIFFEICNPGNQIIDLSNYMFCSSRSSNPADAITGNMNVDSWPNRFEKYVPGYKWLPDYQWAITPGILEEDLNVNRYVYPGDVFCMGTINNDNHLTEDMVWNIPQELDVQFWNKEGTYDTYSNPWGEEVGQPPVPNAFTELFYMFKILNDSVQRGLKPANDPNDFELIEAVGMADVSRWYVGGEKVAQRTTYTRKPEIIIGNPVLESSFGTNLDDTEWIVRNRPYYGSRGIGQPEDVYIMESGLGQHYFNEPTQYMSTVTAVVYKVSPGYSMNENIKGIVTGATVADFMANIYKAHEEQTLKVKSFSDGSELGMDALLSLNDTLVVMSADSTNTTKYILEVNDQGLSSNAVLTSTKYQIEILTDPKSAGDENAGTGAISGFEYGTTLKTMLANITVPPGATLTAINDEGLYVPLKKLNFDTAYVNVTVNHNTYFEVVAENATTKILYQLQPEVSENTAFITSDDYKVSQKDLLIEFVPRGTNSKVFLNNIVPSLGATLKLVDKFGFERTEGQIVQDDRLIVTSPNGEVQIVYYLSMLRTQYVKETTYLAYITSNRYGVDQVNYRVNGVDGTTSVSDFYSRITPSQGATAVVFDSEGNEKNTGDIDRGDMVKVTSLDGDVTTMYTFGNLTGIETSQFSQIQLYPNPTDSKIRIKGLSPGSRIQVYNASGVAIRDIFSQEQERIISLDAAATGLYLIVISDKDGLQGRYKVIKK